MTGRAVGTPQIEAQIAQIERSGCAGFHHYCWALITRNHALIFSNTPTTSDYGYMINDFGYVFKSSRPGCMLAPDMHVKSGEYYATFGRYAEAETSYREALIAKKGYAPAIVGLSDLYEIQGALDKSIAVLQAGIKDNPNSTALKKKLARVQARSAPASADR